MYYYSEYQIGLLPEERAWALKPLINKLDKVDRLVELLCRGHFSTYNMKMLQNLLREKIKIQGGIVSETVSLDQPVDLKLVLDMVDTGLILDIQSVDRFPVYHLFFYRDQDIVVQDHHISPRFKLFNEHYVKYKHLGQEHLAYRVSHLREVAANYLNSAKVVNTSLTVDQLLCNAGSILKYFTHEDHILLERINAIGKEPLIPNTVKLIKVLYGILFKFWEDLNYDQDLDSFFQTADFEWNVYEIITKVFSVSEHKRLQLHMQANTIFRKFLSNIEHALEYNLNSNLKTPSIKLKEALMAHHNRIGWFCESIEPNEFQGWRNNERLALEKEACDLYDYLLQF